MFSLLLLLKYTLSSKHADSTRVGDSAKAAEGKGQRGAAVQDSEELHHAKSHYAKSHSKTSTVHCDGSTKKKLPSPQLEEETLFYRVLSANNLRVHSVIKGDGNCLFRAVEDQLKRLDIFRSHTYKSLREVAVEELARRQDLPGFLVNENAEEYIQRMSKDKEWAGHHELAALASALEVNIKVVTPPEDPDKAIRSCGNFIGPTILLGLYNCHYCSLRPISPDEKDVPIRWDTDLLTDRDVDGLTSAKLQGNLPSTLSKEEQPRYQQELDSVTRRFSEARVDLKNLEAENEELRHHIKTVEMSHYKGLRELEKLLVRHKVVEEDGFSVEKNAVLPSDVRTLQMVHSKVRELMRESERLFSHKTVEDDEGSMAKPIAYVAPFVRQSDPDSSSGSNPSTEASSDGYDGSNESDSSS